MESQNNVSFIDAVINKPAGNNQVRTIVLEPHRTIRFYIDMDKAPIKSVGFLPSRHMKHIMPMFIVHNQLILYIAG